MDCNRVLIQFLLASNVQTVRHKHTHPALQHTQMLHLQTYNIVLIIMRNLFKAIYYMHNFIQYKNLILLLP